MRVAVMMFPPVTVIDFGLLIAESLKRFSSPGIYLMSTVSFKNASRLELNPVYWDARQRSLKHLLKVSFDCLILL